MDVFVFPSAIVYGVESLSSMVKVIPCKGIVINDKSGKASVRSMPVVGVNVRFVASVYVSLSGKPCVFSEANNSPAFCEATAALMTCIILEESHNIPGPIE